MRCCEKFQFKLFSIISFVLGKLKLFYQFHNKSYTHASAMGN